MPCHYPARTLAKEIQNQESFRICNNNLRSESYEPNSVQQLPPLRTVETKDTLSRSGI